MRSIPLGVVSLIVFATVAIYGMRLVEPTTTYDFAAAKGSAFKVFLTYFFMKRALVGMFAALFHDFSPFWNSAIGLFCLFVSACLMWVLIRRLHFSRQIATLGAVAFLSTPFFFNNSIYQHAMPAGCMGFCFDAVALLSFVELREKGALGWSFFLMASVSSALATCIYQAHAGLLLTGMFGVCALDPREKWRDLFIDIWRVISILGFACAIWAIVSFGPEVILMLIGYKIPHSGGCHDTIYWFTGVHPFITNLKALIVGFILNWGYNAFFIWGLRCVIALLLFFAVVIVLLFFKRRVIFGGYVFLFIISIFALPVLQGSVANLRTHYCLIVFLCFGFILALKILMARTVLKKISAALIVYFMIELGHETSTLYYYNWKVKHHDEMHMAVIAHDLWSKYGKDIQKPVAIIGGWKRVSTCWEDMRPFRELPLINHPFTTYSNVNECNVPREFYMVAREKVGLVVRMPDRVVRENIHLPKDCPEYPSPGYIYETNGVIVVNLGGDLSPWTRFEYENYLSPNEKLLDRTLHCGGLDASLYRLTEPFRALLRKYPWSVEF